MYQLIIDNKELLKVLYAIAIAFICAIIVVKTNRLFRLSLHQGIRYFRNAFFFYGLAFIIRYLIGAPPLYNYIDIEYLSLVNFIFEYFLIMAGFFLIYSLLWKKIEVSGKHYYSSLFNIKLSLFYVMAFIIAILDYLWNTHSFMFFSQIILFAFAIIISYTNYKRNGKQHRFLKFYFIAMLLSFLAWLSNTIAALYLKWNQAILMSVYASNIIIFLLFLYGVVKVTKNGKKERTVKHH